MMWTYDPSVDALTILLSEKKKAARTEEVSPGILVDRAANGSPVAIEILDASTHYPVAVLRALPLPTSMIPLTTAAVRSGLNPATLRQQIHRKRLSAIKWHREWWVEPKALASYLSSRAPQGRRAR